MQGETKRKGERGRGGRRRKGKGEERGQERVEGRGDMEHPVVQMLPSVQQEFDQQKRSLDPTKDGQV